MTVPSATSKSGPYLCNGVTDVFNYDFRIVDKSHLKVLLTDADGNESTLDLTTHYTVSDVGSDTGSINLTSAGVALAVTGTKLTILRNPPFTQETDLENQGAYLAQTVEDRFDLLMMQIQTVKERSDRSIAIAASDEDTTLDELTVDLETIAAIADDVSTVADNDANVTIVAGISADVSTVADNLSDVTNFSDVYLGSKATAPSTRNDGTALHAGDIYFDTSTNLQMFYNGSSWVGGALTGGTSGLAVLAAEDTAALTTALEGAVDTDALASSVYATEAEAQDLDESTASGVKLMTPLRIISALKSFDPVNIDWFGAKGNANTDDSSDDTTALQDALDVFKAPDMSKLPPVGAAWANRAFNGRVLDLKGRCYNVTDTLNADTAYGLTLQNGSLIARGASAWAANAPILTSLNGVSLRIHNMTFEGNQLADGIVLDRCVYGIVTNTNIWGFGTRTFGLRSPTAFGGMSLVLDKINMNGMTAANTAATDSTYQATGFDVAVGSDSMMTNCNTSRLRIGASLAAGGWFLLGNHFTGTGDPSTTDDVGLSLSAGAHYQQVTGCQFDNCILQLWGYAKRNVVNNVWRSDSLNELSCAIKWSATTANEPLGQGIITNNFVQLNGAPTSFDFIKLIESGGKTFGDVSALRVGDNTIIQQSGTAIRSRATYGRLSAAVGAGSFDAGHKTYIDMTNYVLKGSAATATPVFKAWASANTGSGARTFQGYTFTNATDKLALQFDADFTGNVVVNWSYGDEEAPITATSS